MAKIWEFTATTIDGCEQSLGDYRGKTLLVVNVASKCGFTPQYAGLEELYETYADRGFAVLGFPCDQFRNQEPGNEEEIQQFCSLNYGVTFPMFAKIDVNGEHAHPLYKWLRSQKGGLFNDRIKWNFTKFLVGSSGEVIERYGSVTKPHKLTGDIESALAR